SEYRGHWKVGHAAERYDEDQEVAEPPRVDVERILRCLHTAIRERIRDLETLHGPERERRLQHQNPREQRHATRDGEQQRSPCTPRPVNAGQSSPDGPREHSLTQAADSRRAQLVTHELQHGRPWTHQQTVEVARLHELLSEDIEPAR